MDNTGRVLLADQLPPSGALRSLFRPRFRPARKENLLARQRSCILEFSRSIASIMKRPDMRNYLTFDDKVKWTEVISSCKFKQHKHFRESPNVITLLLGKNFLAKFETSKIDWTDRVSLKLSTEELT